MKEGKWSSRPMNWTKRKVSIFNGKIDIVCAYKDDSMRVWRMWNRKGRIGGMIEVRDGPFCTSRMDNSSLVRGQR